MFDHADGLDTESWGLPEEPNAISWYDVMSAANDGQLPIIINIPGYKAVYQASPSITSSHDPLLSDDDELRELVITRYVAVLGRRVEAAMNE